MELHRLHASRCPLPEPGCTQEGGAVIADLLAWLLTPLAKAYAKLFYRGDD
jgi:hypothetical protein